MPRQETYEYNFALRNEYLNISIIYQQDHFCDILEKPGSCSLGYRSRAFALPMLTFSSQSYLSLGTEELGLLWFWIRCISVASCSWCALT